MHRLHHKPGKAGGMNLMRYPALRQIDCYWRYLADAGAVPGRRAIDPTRLEDVVANVFWAGFDPSGRASFREAGPLIRSLLRRDPAGTPLARLFAEADRPQLERLARTVVGTPGVAGLLLRAAPGGGAAPLAAAMMLFPLAAPSETGPEILGVLAGDDVPLPAPPLRIVESTLEALDLPPLPAPVRPRRPAPGLAEDQAAFDTRTRPSRVPWLRVVTDD